MPTYPTLDFLPDLTAAKIKAANFLKFAPYVPGTGTSPYEVWGAHASTESYALLNDTFSFSAKLGASYAVLSSSFFDPFLLRVYDSLGNVIAADNDIGDYGYDYVTFVAPYTGTFYLSASWDQGAYYKAVSVGVWEDKDTIVPKKDNFIAGTLLRDKLTTTKDNDTVNGSDGFDTLSFTGARANYQISKGGGAWVVKDNTEVDGTDVVINVERFLFTDSIISFEVTGVAPQAYRLYQAAFDRVPDGGGLGYWISAMEKGVDIKAVAAGFIASPEFKGLFGLAPTNSQLITALYKNVLHRTPDQGGFDFWVGALNSNAVTPADMLVAFSESAENQAQVIGALAGGYTFW